MIRRLIIAFLTVAVLAKLLGLAGSLPQADAVVVMFGFGAMLLVLLLLIGESDRDRL